MDIDRFEGWIAGLGTAGGLRVVIGRWVRSPLGGFTDVMLEWADGRRVLLAPDPRVADFVAGTYRFDQVEVVPVTCADTGTDGAPPPTDGAATVIDGAGRGGRWRLRAGPLAVDLRVGRRSPLGLLLRLVPTPLATARWWISGTDVIARRVLPGVRTRGGAGGGRREFYAALDVHGIDRASVTWDGADQGALAPVDPPVRFGFGSTPRTPSVARMVTLVESGRR
ncbi:MAG TPA: hypothetical protein VGH99_10885 [Pseudonocardia sp.]